MNNTGLSKEEGRAACSAVVLVGARDGTRLRAISGCESPFMPFPSTFKPWPPPFVVFDYKRIFTTVISPFRASVVGIANGLGYVEPTIVGD